METSVAQPTTLLRRFYDTLENNQIDQLLPFLAEDVIWEVAGPTDIMPWAGEWKGHEGVRQYFILLNEGLASDKLVPTRFIVQGNTAAVVLDGSGETRNGSRFTGGAVHWITITDGKISRLQSYRDAFPIIEALYGGRPFTVQLSQSASHYVISPLAPEKNADAPLPETVKTVLAMYGALQGLKTDELRKVFAEDVVWEMFGPADIIGWSGKWIGPDEAMESAKAIIETMHFEHFKAVGMICEGDTAAVLIDEPGSSKATGLPFHTSVVHIVTAKEGRITKFTNYVNTAGIVEAFLGGRPFVVS
ncbi:nuclear transport factor 2 family protein [Dyadobacter sp. CY323]|uniref:nuclear transport factor 2 family protein n=1 Tax=Dyadobacter sp. CY323 TaxID=2907302 RepID=UPI001F1F1541|nr:nuclear transport factor 2 family protein [Dyadobacter sp. CY323]MCE6990081.1 nuclear transport factor 2 family protein [Dyadobacter sp. CY323]